MHGVRRRYRRPHARGRCDGITARPGRGHTNQHKTTQPGRRRRPAAFCGPGPGRARGRGNDANIRRPRADARGHHAGAAALCGADDLGRSVAADVQRGRHAHRRAVRGGRRAGGRWLGLYADDVFDVDLAGALDGQRRGGVHLVRARRAHADAAGDLSLLRAYRRGGRRAQHRGVCVHRPHLGAAAGPGRDLGPDAHLPAGDLYRHRRYVFVQLFRLPAARGRRLGAAAGVFGRVGGAQHRAGPGVRAGAGVGRGRRGVGHHPVTVAVRPGAVRLCAGHPARPARAARRNALERPLCGACVPAGVYHRRTAVHHELWHFAGAGARQQLWPGHHGGVCGGGQDRLLRVYAGAGFRQRVLDVFGAELRRRAA